MKTELIKLESANADSAQIMCAGELLRNGELVAIPTETVYGLAANAFDDAAVAKIFKAKGRPQDNPLIVHISEPDELATLAAIVPDSARRLAAAFWPGPLTMILRKNSKIPDSVTAGLPSVAIRCPEHMLARAVIRASGVPLAAPSANTSGKPSPTSAEHVLRDLDGKIPLILDGGTCRVGLESTVIDLTGDTPTLLRPGGITLTQLRKVLGTVLMNPKVLEAVSDDEVVASPGMKYRHYAPTAPVTIIDGEASAAAEFVRQNIKGRKAAILCFEEEKVLFDIPNTQVVTYGKKNAPEELAHELFFALRRLDELAPDVIFAREPDCGDGIELAVVNRLSRAAAFSRIRV